MTFPYIKWDSVEWTANFVAVITTPVYMKIISILETLHYLRNLETGLV